MNRLFNPEDNTNVTVYFKSGNTQTINMVTEVADREEKLVIKSRSRHLITRVSNVEFYAIH